jgi:putative ABC transport system substrate-binding protein
VRRREFLKIIGGVTAAWPVASIAQQAERVRRIGVLMNRAADDPDAQARLAAFLQALQQLGWIDGRNVRIDTRWGEDKIDLERKYAAELLALAPDIILASGAPSVTAFQQISGNLPIVFVGVVDPVGAGFADSLARPGGSTTGFMIYEYSLGGKWLELLKQVAPSLRRVAVLRDSNVPSGTAIFAAVQNAAQSLGVEVRPVIMRDAGEIERAVVAFARSGNGGLIVAPSGSTSVHRFLLITLAVRHKLPAVYPYRHMVAAGGLMSYSPDLIDPFRRAADYVDRILKGEKPGDLPVQAPTKYELVINLKTAKALGIVVLPTLLARADEVIE